MPEIRLVPGQEILVDGVSVIVKECRYGSVLLVTDLEPRVVKPVPAEAACEVPCGGESNDSSVC